VKSIMPLHFGRSRQLLIQGREDGPGKGARGGNIIALWDVERGREVRRFGGVLPPGSHGVLSPEGGHVAIVSGKQVRILDVTSGRERRVIPLGPRTTTVSVALNDRVLACVESRRRLTVWELATGRQRWRVEVPETEEWMRQLRFSPDGRWLAMVRGREVELWDALRGKKVHTFSGHASSASALAFSPDGRRLASAGFDTTVLIWDVATVLARRPRPQGKLDATALAAAWQDLASRDARRACQAMALLVEAPGESVSLLRGRLKPLPAPDRKRLARLLADLDSDEVADRDRASEELDRLGAQAEATLTAFLAGKVSAEARRRAERLLQRLAAPVRDPDQLRRLRALEVLERIDTPEARRALRALGPAPDTPE
jgi:hypothetical protein